VGTVLERRPVHVRRLQLRPRVFGEVRPLVLDGWRLARAADRLRRLDQGMTSRHNPDGMWLASRAALPMVAGELSRKLVMTID